jgi:hypothetical protein
MREATEVAREFAAANREAAASVRELQAALDEIAGMTAAVMARHPAKAVVAEAVDTVARGLP